LQIKKQKLSDQKIVIFGQGQAGTGISRQILNALQEEGLSLEEAKEHVFGVDKDGLLLEGMNVNEWQKMMVTDRSLVYD